MSIKRFLLAAAAASILVVGFVPVAQAARLDAGVCIERHHDVGPEGRVRDLVTAPKVDRLQRWIRNNPTLAASRPPGDEAAPSRSTCGST